VIPASTPARPGTSAATASTPVLARKIAFVIFNLSGGGAERVVSALSGYWAREGRDVTVLTIASSESDFYDLAHGVRRVALDLAVNSRSAVQGAVEAARRTYAVGRILRRLAPDVVISFMPQTNVMCLLATAGAGLPVIVCERSNPRMAPLPRHWAALRRLLYPRASAVVVQTEDVARWARDLSRRVHVIPNFVARPARTATSLAASGPKRLFGVGRLVPAKGFDLLIAAFARVAGPRPDWSLTILGEGRERPRLAALAARLGVADRVAMPGRVANPADHLVEGHAFALSSRFEGFPNALLEAMACGLPVVAFDCPHGPADAIVHEHDGLLVPAGDVAALAASLARLMDSPLDRSRLGQNAKDVVAKLGPEQVLPRWTALLDGACSGRER
jgi:glycosyltransferase involved in cell wall biosynthesis